MTFAYPSGVSNIPDLLLYINSITNNWFGILILFAVFVISFLSMKGSDPEKAFTASSFISSLVAATLVILQLLNSEIMIAMVMITAISLILLIKSPNP
jgi:hypothetical protein